MTSRRGSEVSQVVGRPGLRISGSWDLSVRMSHAAKLARTLSGLDVWLKDGTQSFASGSFLTPSSNGHDPEKSAGARDRVGLQSPGAGQWYSPNELSSVEVPQKLSRSWQQPGVHSWLPFSPFLRPPKLETMQSSSIGCKKLAFQAVQENAQTCPASPSYTR